MTPPDAAAFMLQRNISDAADTIDRLPDGEDIAPTRFSVDEDPESGGIPVAEDPSPAREPLMAPRSQIHYELSSPSLSPGPITPASMSTLPARAAASSPTVARDVAPSGTRRRRQSPAVQVCLAVALAVVSAIAHVYLHLQVLDTGYNLSRETRLRHDLADQNRKLRLEIDTRHTLSTIERRAREELHMAAPDPATIRVVRLASPAAATENARPAQPGSGS